MRKHLKTRSALRINLVWLQVILSAGMIFFSCKGKNEASLNANILSMLFFKDTIVYYNGVLTDETVFEKITYDSSEVASLINRNKKKYKEKFQVLLKVTHELDVLEPAGNVSLMISAAEVTWTGSRLSAAERSIFQTDNFNRKPPEPVRVEMPKISHDSEVGNEPAFWIRFKKNGSILYKIDSGKHKNPYIKLAKNDSIALFKVVADYKSQYVLKGKKERIYIKGNNVKYSSFEIAVNACRKNDLFQYYVIAEPAN